MMAKNAEAFIGASINSLGWTNGIYLYDDNSSDRTVEKARLATHVPLFIEQGQESRPVFSRGEMECRNTLTDKAFLQLGCDVLILIDSDELMSRELEPVLRDVFTDPKIDSLCFPIWHLFDQCSYLHFWETHMNGVLMLDPHIRVVRSNKRYQTGFSDGSHPFIKSTDFTRCLHGPYHFHLKYHEHSPFPNYALRFLPKHLTRHSVQGFLRNLPFDLPSDVAQTLLQIEWSSMIRSDTEYYSAYETPRVALTPIQALIHPRDASPPC